VETSVAVPLLAAAFYNTKLLAVADTHCWLPMPTASLKNAADWRWMSLQYSTGFFGQRRGEKMPSLILKKMASSSLLFPQHNSAQAVILNRCSIYLQSLCDILVYLSCRGWGHRYLIGRLSLCGFYM
jgi:hypothetical protein